MLTMIAPNADKAVRAHDSHILLEIAVLVFAVLIGPRARVQLCQQFKTT